ncbi:MAG: alpha/beta hydrolase [Crocosphaera sp.]|nr:alpha/beta hydrolase [Crocosphaera sp.]
MMTEKFWEAYCQEVLEIDKQEIRPLCEPKLLHHGEKTANAIVLIHGLSDSPFSMAAIGKKFYQMGFNVLLPLLPGHGLKDGKTALVAMREQTLLIQWKKAVKYAVTEAKKMGHKVSIGGLSAGGVLSTYYAINDPQDIQGALFLFSAALDFGDFREKLVRKNFIFVEILKILIDTINFKEKGDFVGKRPYAYGWVPTESSERLAELILEIEKKYSNKNKRYNDLQCPVFAVHSEYDQTAGIEEIELLINNHPKGQEKTEFFRIKEDFYVTHYRVVLSDNTYNLDNPPQPIESKNPFFPEMIEVMKNFVYHHLSKD